MLFLIKPLSLDRHVNLVCKSALFHLRNIVRLGSTLLLRALKLLFMPLIFVVWTIVTRCSPGHEKYLIIKLQRIQKCAVRALASVGTANSF